MRPAKIVVLDKPYEASGELDWSALRALGEAVIYDRTPPALVARRLEGAQIAVLNESSITRGVLDACPALGYISVIGTGFNTVDTEAAAVRGIPVSNTPTYGTEGIAQHAIALLLETTNHVASLSEQAHGLRRGAEDAWCFWDRPLIELAGKTMGIVGLGRIGCATARIARAFGMRVIYFDPIVGGAGGAGNCLSVSLGALLEQSDVVVLHCPLLPSTARVIDRDAIRRMKCGAVLINNSRGGLIDEDAVADALKSGKLWAAGLDTVAEEPIVPGNPLLSAPNCYITPHISWASIESRRRLRDQTVENVRSFLKGKPQNVVNGL